MNNFQIRPIKPEHRQQITKILQESWGSSQSVSRGRIHEGDLLPGYIAIRQNHILGLVTYHLEQDQCEIVTLNSLEEGKGIGGRLIEAVKSKAEESKCRRIWLITTNDNTHAIRFYQKQGFYMAALYPNAIQRSRALKPSIPSTGFHDIPIRDEIEFEYILGI